MRPHFRSEVFTCQYNRTPNSGSSPCVARELPSARQHSFGAPNAGRRTFLINIVDGRPLGNDDLESVKSTTACRH